MASRLAGTCPEHVGDDDTTGTVKSVLRNVTLASFKGPVKMPVSGIVNGPIVHESPNTPVLPLTVASKVTAKPLGDDEQANPPVMVPGSATKGTFGNMPGTRVSAADRDPKTCPSGGDVTDPVAPQGAVPLTTVTTPQNFAVMSATVAGPAVRIPLRIVPTRPNWYGAPGGPDGWGMQSAGRLPLSVSRLREP
jgi:hypothetical protein